MVEEENQAKMDISNSECHITQRIRFNQNLKMGNISVVTPLHH